MIGLVSSMKHFILSFFSSLFFFLTIGDSGFAKTYTVQFGGNFGFTYFSKSLTVNVGDTIEGHSMQGDGSLINRLCPVESYSILIVFPNGGRFFRNLIFL
jgi:hypothetical protein